LIEEGEKGGKETRRWTSRVSFLRGRGHPCGPELKHAGREDQKGFERGKTRERNQR